MATKKKDGASAGGAGREGRSRAEQRVPGRESGIGRPPQEGDYVDAEGLRRDQYGRTIDVSDRGFASPTGKTLDDFPRWAIDEAMPDLDDMPGQYMDDKGELFGAVARRAEGLVAADASHRAWAAKTGGKMVKGLGHDGRGVAYDLSNMSRDQVAAAISIPKEGFVRGSLELTFKGPETTIWIRDRRKDGRYTVTVLPDTYPGERTWSLTSTMKGLARAKAGGDAYEALGGMYEGFTGSLPWDR